MDVNFDLLWCLFFEVFACFLAGDGRGRATGLGLGWALFIATSSYSCTLVQVQLYRGNTGMVSGYGKGKV